MLICKNIQIMYNIRMKNVLKECHLCPRNCNINRYKQKGFCGQNNNIKVALAKPFFYEEPPISGKNGSGTIFFTGCNLKCIFCQNYEISHQNKGLTITITRLSEIMLELQNKGCHNINLVTPTIFVPQIIKAIKIAKRNGLTIPIIYNSSGYENIETIKMLNGYIDVYLPDLKYYDDTNAIKYSKAYNYFNYASSAIEEMIKQVGPCQFDKNNLITKGVIVRHMMLPGMLEDSKKIIKYLSQFKERIYLSIMNQYTPTKNVQGILKNTVTDSEYDTLINYALDLGIKNAFIQEGGTISESFIPDFNYEGIKK